MHLQDGSLSPQPPSSSFLDTVGEEDHVGSDRDGSETTDYGLFGGSVDLHSPLSIAFQGEDTDMLDMPMDLDGDPWLPSLSISAAYV
jgi:hypothetical protein